MRWSGQLSRMIEEQYPAEFRALVIQIAYELQGKVKEKTPHKTGRLQDSWKVGPITRKGGAYYIEVYSNVEYAEPVEYGHRTRGGRGFGSRKAYDGAFPGRTQPGASGLSARMAQRFYCFA